ncbi:hypothetical protein AURDEDRAFT_170561 [Auricularia subglabra TFB-10046 SS5]|nr:hypothetical protein AURDEDRAFT_170561 [Auricularia subglabra TFB-10046 SS5]
MPPQEFPNLRTLILPIDGPWHPMLVLRDMVHCGTLRAPNLCRLVISYSPQYAEFAIPAIPPANLALFITHHLELAPDRVLDELVLEKGKITLEDSGPAYGHALEVLENYVGAILAKPTETLTQPL